MNKAKIIQFFKVDPEYCSRELNKVPSLVRELDRYAHQIPLRTSTGWVSHNSDGTVDLNR